MLKFELHLVWYSDTDIHTRLNQGHLRVSWISKVVDNVYRTVGTMQFIDAMRAPANAGLILVSTLTDSYSIHAILMTQNRIISLSNIALDTRVRHTYN